MKNCPQCGQPRQGEAYKCPSCDVFYSQLDELLFEDEQKRESQTWKGAWKRVLAAENPRKAVLVELRAVWKRTPLKTKIVLWTIIAFIFMMTMPIL